ncbi:MAG: metal ABC transporter permease [Verrucomicrobiota bacterium]
MDDLIELLSYPFNQRALLAATIIGLLNGYLSGYVVARRAALFTGALSHTLLPGIAVGILLFGVGMISNFIGALAAAMIVALGALAIGRNTRVDRDSALAILYTTSFSAGLLMLDSLPVSVEINSILFGNILGLADTDLWLIFGVAGVALSVLILLQRPLQLMLFEPDVARSLGVPVGPLQYVMVGLLVLTLVTSLQAVGAILSLGLLVTPGAIMMLFVTSPRKLFWGGGFVGVACSLAAIVVSNALDIRTGAAIVLFLGLVFFLSLVLNLGGRHLNKRTIRS